MRMLQQTIHLYCDFETEVLISEQFPQENFFEKFVSPISLLVIFKKYWQKVTFNCFHYLGFRTVTTNCEIVKNLLVLKQQTISESWGRL